MYGASENATVIAAQSSAGCGKEPMKFSIFCIEVGVRPIPMNLPSKGMVSQTTQTLTYVKSFGILYVLRHNLVLPHFISPYALVTWQARMMLQNKIAEYEFFFIQCEYALFERCDRHADMVWIIQCQMVCILYLFNKNCSSIATFSAWKIRCSWVYLKKFLTIF